MELLSTVRASVINYAHLLGLKKWSMHTVCILFLAIEEQACLLEDVPVSD
jgi:hypothetical protein